MGLPEGQRPLGRPSRRWELNIICNFRKWGVGTVGLDRAGSG